MLYMVATPIGNLDDISNRALEVLKKVDLIAAEDTRVSKVLLSKFGISTKLISLHKFNERDRANEIIDKIIAEGIDVAYISDAGTPAVSDPGAILARIAWEKGVVVSPVPGASAVVSALSISGFLSNEFTFYGFLPRKKGEITEVLLEYSKRSKIGVFYESPHRVIELMEIAAGLFKDCDMLLCCDLTKLYEKSLRGKPKEILENLLSNPKAEKGEYCLLIDFSNIEPKEKNEEISLEARLFDCVLKGKNLKEAIKILSNDGFKKNELYEASLRLKSLLKSDI